VGGKERLAFGVALGGQGVSLHIINNYLNYFFINIFHVNSNIVAAMLLAEGIWDTVNDPLMGALIDRTRTRWGKLRPYLLAVPIPMALTTVALFAGPILIKNPGENALSKVFYIFVTYFLWETFYTISDIPFWGMSAAVSPNPQDRTRIISYARFISGCFGGLPTMAVPVILDLSNKPGGLDIKKAFFIIGLIAGIAGMGLFSLAGLKVRERIVQSEEQPSLRECLDCIVKNPPLRLLILRNFIYALCNTGNAFSTYFFLDVLGSASYSVLAAVPGGFTDPLSYVFIPAIKKRFNNKQIVIFSQLLISLLHAGTYFIGVRWKRNVLFMVALMMAKNGIEALFNGASFVIPTEMVGETVDYMEWKTGWRPEGVNFSVLSFFNKITGVIARALGAYLLKPIGYQTSAANAMVPQTERTKQGIWFMLMAFPVIFRLLSLIPMFFYDLVGKKRDTMMEEIAVRRAERSQEVSE